MDQIANFLFLLVAVSQRRIINSQFASGFHAFMAGGTLQSSLRFMEPRQMVMMMSAFKYVMKAAVFWRAKQENFEGDKFPL